jgi:hypothetical protein
MERRYEDEFDGLQRANGLIYFSTHDAKRKIELSNGVYLEDECDRCRRCFDKMGIIDLNGKMIVDIDRYNFIGEFHDGLAAVSNEFKKVGFIDFTGSEVISCIYDDASDFANRICKVALNGDSFVIDTSGKRVE